MKIIKSLNPVSLTFTGLLLGALIGAIEIGWFYIVAIWDPNTAEMLSSQVFPPIFISLFYAMYGLVGGFAFGILHILISKVIDLVRK